MDSHVFLSFAREDLPSAGRIQEALRQAGMTVWMDVDAIVGDLTIERQVVEALRGARALVVIVSPRSQESAWVHAEIGFALAADLPVVPVVLSNTPLPWQLNHLRAVHLPEAGPVPHELVEILTEAPAAPEPEWSDLVQQILGSWDDGTFSRLLDEMDQHVVLVLGSFRDPHKERLMALTGALKKHHLHGFLFDFTRPESADYGETIRLLAGMSSFIVADLADARSSLMELQLVVPTLAKPVVPIIERSTREQKAGSHLPALFQDLQKYDWVLPVVEYEDFDQFQRELRTRVIRPALKKRDAINARRRPISARNTK